MNEENTTQVEETAASAAKDEAEETSAEASGKSAENDVQEASKPARAENSEKTFTQAEVDKMIEKRLARERSSAETKADKALKEIIELKNANACYKAGIKDDCVEDAVTLANKLVNDKTDFSAALKKVIEKYPQFVKGTVNTGITTGTKTSNNSDNGDKALRAAFGLK